MAQLCMSPPHSAQLRGAGRISNPRLGGPPSVGLTLVELLVVVVILTTLVGAAIPLLSPNNDSRKIREGARLLNTYITAARTKAVSTGRPYGVALKKLSSDFLPSGPGGIFTAQDQLRRGEDRGASIEAFQIRRPADYSGFSQHSVLMVQPLPAALAPSPEGILFQPPDTRYPPVVLASDGSLFVRLVFGRHRPRTDADPVALSPTGQAIYDPLFFELEPLPPNVIRRGDIVEVGGLEYVLWDDDLDRDNNRRQTDQQDQLNSDGYYVGNNSGSRQNNFLVARLKDHTFSFVAIGNNPTTIVPPLPPQTMVHPPGVAPSNPLALADITLFSAPRPYRIRRRPVRSSAPPLQMPAGVAVDLQASGLDPGALQAAGQGAVASAFPSCCHNPLTSMFANDDPNARPNNDDSVAILFGPDGKLLDFIWNIGNVENTTVPFGVPTAQKVARNVYFLVGRRENIPVTLTLDQWRSRVGNPTAVESVRDEINWLAGDSLWVTIGARSGRVVTTENAFINPTPSAPPDPWTGQPRFDYSNPLNTLMSIQRQLIDAREYAIEMRPIGGR